MVRAGKDNTFDLVHTGRLVQIHHAGDVGCQNRGPRLFSGDPAHVYHCLYAFEEFEHSACIFERTGPDFFAAGRLRKRRDVAQSQRVAVALQTRPQLLAQAAGRPGEQQA